MKRKTGLLLAALVVLLCAFALADVEINEDNFPDAHFRSIVKRSDRNGDGILSDEEIAAVTLITCEDEEVSSLEGIGYFTNLQTLKCPSQKLRSLDLRKNTALVTLDCSENRLTNLNLSKNTALEVLDCGDNRLKKLDVTKNTALRELSCEGNQVTALDLGRNTKLKNV